MLGGMHRAARTGKMVMPKRKPARGEEEWASEEQSFVRTYNTPIKPTETMGPNNGPAINVDMKQQTKHTIYRCLHITAIYFVTLFIVLIFTW